jgi:hypothetical protein
MITLFYGIVVPHKSESVYTPVIETRYDEYTGQPYMKSGKKESVIITLDNKEISIEDFNKLIQAIWSIGLDYFRLNKKIVVGESIHLFETDELYFEKLSNFYISDEEVEIIKKKLINLGFNQQPEYLVVNS